MIPSGRRPDRIERDIEDTRARMESTLSSLEANLTPGQLFDRALGYVKNNDAAKRAGKWAGRTTVNQMKHNPIAFGLIGAGVAWWIFGGRSKSRVSARRETTHEPHAYGVEVDLEERTAVGLPMEPSYAGDFGAVGDEGPGRMAAVKEKAAARAHELREKASDKVEEAREGIDEARMTAESKTGGVRHKVVETSSRAKSSARQAASSLKHKANDIASGAKTRASDARRSMRTAYGKAASSSRSAAYKAKERASRAGADLSHQAREHPFIFAGLAFTLATAVGALLRPTRREDRLLGPRRDGLLERADDMGARGVERARDVANRAFEVAHEKARGEEIEGETAPSAASGTSGMGSSVFEQSADSEIDRSGVAPAPPEVPETRDRMPRSPGER